MSLKKSRREQYTRKTQEDFPKKLSLPKFTKKLSLRYGINPGTPAAFYAEQGASGPNMANFEILQEGKGLGFINIADMDLGQRVVKTLHSTREDLVACCIVKHEIPSAVALGINSHEAFYHAWHSDPLSSFGGVHVFSSEVDISTASEIVEKRKNTEVVYAPKYASEALEVFKERESLRVVKMEDIKQPSIDDGLEYKRVKGGLLVEKRFYTKILSPKDVECISERQPTEDEYQAAIFNWVVASYTRSNAIVIGTKNMTHGIGSGQRSRIDAAYDAIRIANGRNNTNHCYGSEDTFMASDAYMPQTDVVELAAEAGITGIIFPLGSIKDRDVIDTANELNLTLLATRSPGETDCERCFTHR